MAKLENNLAEGSVIKQLVSFSIPFILTGVVQNLYGLVDMIAVGQFAGAASLSGVNTAASTVNITTNLATGFCVGGTVLIGQYLGMNDRKKLQDSIGTLFVMIAMLAVLFTVVFIVFCDPILTMLQTPEEAYGEARDYMIVSAAGYIFIFAYNAISAILRGMGDSRHPLVFVTIAGVINIALDIIFIGPMHMAAFGAALATIIAQAVSVILSIIYLRRNDFVFSFSLKSFCFKKDLAKLLFNVGFPNGVQNCAGIAAFVVITAVTNTLGVSYSAALAGAQKITLFAILPGVGVGNAVAAMCAQNFGAGRRDRALETMKSGFLVLYIVNIAVFAIVELFPGPMMKIFTSDPEIIEHGKYYLRLCSFDYLFVPFQGAVCGYLIGSGHTVLPSAISLFNSVVFRGPSAYILGILFGLGFTGASLASPIASFAVAVICTIYLLTGAHKRVEAVTRREELPVNT